MNYKHTQWLRLMLFVAVLVGLVCVMAERPGDTTLAQSGGTLGYGSKVYGTVSAETPVVTYGFSGSIGDFVAVTVDKWTGALDVHLDLVAPNGLVLGSSTQNMPGNDPTGAYFSVFLRDTGIYLLRISGENGTTGDFLLTLLGHSPVEATLLVYGQAVDVNIPQNAATQYYSFETESCPTTLVVSDPSQGQPFTFPYVVRVYDQRGLTVALLRGGDQIEDWVTVQPNSGRYEVEVLSADPSLAGSIRLLVTCSGDNPGCPAGQAGLAGIPGLECTPCPGPGNLVPGGGCPDLNLTVQQGLHMATATTVFWDPMPGAEGYTVYVYALTTDGGEVYLTHADWSPGDPTEFTWILPVEGYIGYRFVLDVLVEGDVICTQEAFIDIESTSLECPDLGLTATVTDESVNAVTVGWAAGLGADEFALVLYSLTDMGEGLSGTLVLPGDATGRAFDHFPPELNGVRFVLWMTRGGILCSDEITVTFEGPPTQYVCPDLGLSATHDPEAHTITVTWFGLEEIEGYEFEVYGTDAGGTETLLDSAGLGAGTLSATYVYTDGYIGFRFVVRTVGGPIECTGELVTGSQNQQQPECTDFTLGVTSSTDTQFDLAWSAYPEADGYAFMLMDESRNPVPGYSVILAATQLSLSLMSPPLDPGTYIVSVGPWDDVTGTICTREVTITFAGTAAECTIRADREGVEVRVGPGESRAVFTYLMPGIEYPVVGQATDAEGNGWWEVDKTRFPGGEAAISLWVAQDDVLEIGNCSQVPPGEVPPVIPGGEEVPPGTWGECGSCDTCGHPASECHTSPEGLCVWDPATCVEGPPPGGECYTVTAAIDMGNCVYTTGSAMIDTVPNCGTGQYTPGTAMAAHAVAVDPKCQVASWSGCGASGSGSSVSFTATSSCTVTAHMHE